MSCVFHQALSDWLLPIIKVSVLFVGSSHIRRLEIFMQSMHQVDVFDLPDRIRNIINYGISGGYVRNSTHTKQLCAKVKNSRPEVVFVQIGGNDLDCWSKHGSLRGNCFKTTAVGPVFKTKLWSAKGGCVGVFTTLSY